MVEGNGLEAISSGSKGDCEIDPKDSSEGKLEGSSDGAGEADGCKVGTNVGIKVVAISSVVELDGKALVK